MVIWIYNQEEHQKMRESRSNIERHADGTVTRKSKRYIGKRVNKRSTATWNL